MSLRNIGGLVTMNDDFFIITSHFSCTTDDNPVFTPMVVHLQAEAVTRLNFNPLDFVASSFFQNMNDPQGRSSVAATLSADKEAGRESAGT